MEETREDAGPAEQGPSNVSWWPSDFDETLSNKESPQHFDKDRTGVLSEPIPNGFYSVIPETRLKELFDSIPTLDELHALGGEGFKANIILVDSKKDKKLSMLKKLIMALVRGLNSNPTTII
ncbi:hypothetical protein D0Y65_006708 [Glycine soja]|uniref:EDR1/CTR1/ARMC3-like peptidase-like domain-containing protein n=1 Tax=Glycine soja TaxID=3848 RepID=A0A445LA02_GLYSO|nr:hypothetical protein D0Y65_006708 [Glycine soja]